MKVSEFNFFLPENLIAKRPLKKRDRSRLLVIYRDGSMEHRHFFDLPAYLEKGDMLLLNNTGVFPARLNGLKQNGEKLEILFVRKKGDNEWEILSKGKYTGILRFSENLTAEIYNGNTAHFNLSGNLMDFIWKYGKMPLPPYIKRPPDESDRETYQSIFAKKEGSIAAPTAGLHFTESLLKDIESKGVIINELTLHIGIGTFKPIRAENVEDHFMEKEYFELDKKIIDEIKRIKKSGSRVISVGTTTTRALEALMSGRCNVISHNGRLKGTTDLFIYPGYSFKAVDSLITNFHLPKSTPLMLASAMSGWEKLLKTYEEAIAREYRFLSYGDAMLIL
ncbi:MAG: tRNA preQ1(34) S-adenosylmethionine ribosyltransferase-isomerase QueA [Nitrospirae bacterium]|nr:tRNA preQ1(34) S-adenosylmethionine ribosyltransferase-isomerase QueA [Nitrospirota bacterium]